MARSNRWISDHRRQAVYDADGRRCWYCDITEEELQQDEERPYLTLDHLTPCCRWPAWRERKGDSPNNVRNLVTACWHCNDRKRTLTVAEYLADDPDRLAAIRLQVRDKRKLTRRTEWWRIELATRKRLHDAVVARMREHLNDGTTVRVDGADYMLVPYVPDEDIPF